MLHVLLLCKLHKIICIYIYIYIYIYVVRLLVWMINIKLETDFKIRKELVKLIQQIYSEE
jgi:hypothetical protein